MTEAEVRAQLAGVAAKAVGWAGELPAGDLAEHLDSMQRLTLVVAIEDHFRVAFDERAEEELRTVDDVVRALLREVGGG